MEQNDVFDKLNLSNIEFNNKYIKDYVTTLLGEFEKLKELTKDGRSPAFEYSHPTEVVEGKEVSDHLMLKLIIDRNGSTTAWVVQNGKRVYGYEFLVEFDIKDFGYGIYYGCKGIIPPDEDLEKQKESIMNDWNTHEAELKLLLNRCFDNIPFDKKTIPTTNDYNHTFWPFWIRLNENEDIINVAGMATILIARFYLTKVLKSTTKYLPNTSAFKIDNTSYYCTEWTLHNSILKNIKIDRDYSSQIMNIMVDSFLKELKNVTETDKEFIEKQILNKFSNMDDFSKEKNKEEVISKIERPKSATSMDKQDLKERILKFIANMQKFWNNIQEKIRNSISTDLARATNELVDMNILNKREEYEYAWQFNEKFCDKEMSAKACIYLITMLWKILYVRAYEQHLAFLFKDELYKDKDFFYEKELAKTRKTYLLNQIWLMPDGKMCYDPQNPGRETNLKNYTIEGVNNTIKHLRKKLDGAK